MLKNFIKQSLEIAFWYKKLSDGNIFALSIYKNHKTKIPQQQFYKHQQWKLLNINK